MEKNEIFTFMSESGGSSRGESSVYQKKKKSHITNYQELEKEKERKYTKFFLLLVKS